MAMPISGLGGMQTTGVQGQRCYASCYVVPTVLGRVWCVCVVCVWCVCVSELVSE